VIDEPKDLSDGYSPKARIYVDNGQPWRNTVASISIGTKPSDCGELQLVDLSRVYFVERKPFERGEDFKTSIGISQEDGEVLMNVLWSAGVRPTWWKSDNESISAHKAHIDSLKEVAGHFMRMQDRQTGPKND
jgi:hypothetical protein